MATLASGPTRSVVNSMRLRRKYGFVVLSLAPIFLWFLIFAYGPIVYSLWASLTNTHTLNPKIAHFVGLNNYVSLLSDRRFLLSMKNVVLFVLVKMVLNITLSLGLAILLERIKHGRNFYLFFI